MRLAKTSNWNAMAPFMLTTTVRRRLRIKCLDIALTMDN